MSLEKVKIVHKQSIGVQPVYDISVPGAHHYLLDSGVVSHNSGFIYASSIVVLVAERLTDNDESSALWSASDLMRDVISSTEEALSKIRQDLWVLKEKAPEAKKRGRPAKKVSKK